MSSTRISELESTLKSLKDDFLKSQMDVTIAEKNAAEAIADASKLKQQLERVQAENVQTASEKASAEEKATSALADVARLSAELAAANSAHCIFLVLCCQKTKCSIILWEVTCLTSANPTPNCMKRGNIVP